MFKRGIFKSNNMVVRLRRRGHYKYPVYDIVLTLQSKQGQGAFVEKLGHLNPNQNEKALVINSERLGY